MKTIKNMTKLEDIILDYNLKEGRRLEVTWNEWNGRLSLEDIRVEPYKVKIEENEDKSLTDKNVEVVETDPEDWVTRVLLGEMTTWFFNLHRHRINTLVELKNRGN